MKQAKAGRSISRETRESAKPTTGSKAEIAAIDQLLTTAAELMKRAPGLDRQAFEYLRRLRVSIRFAIAAAASRDADELPASAPEKFLERNNTQEGPIEFIQRVYHPWIQKKIICRADLKFLDRSLYNALCNWISKYGDPPNLDLPTKKEMNDRKLAAMGPLQSPSRWLRVSELPANERQRLRLYDVARHRKKNTTNR